MKDEAAERKALELLPCEKLTRLCDSELEELCYGCQLRPAVAAALREAQSANLFPLAKAKWREKDAEIEHLKAEIAKLEALGIEFDEDFNRIKAEREHFEKLYNQEHQLALDQASIVIEANTDCNQLKAERDAAYVRGLERAREMLLESGYGLWVDQDDALLAEIAKLKDLIAEQEGQIDRADEHTAKIMKALEVAERERDEFRQKRIKMSDLASHNLDEREKLIAEVAKLKDEQEKLYWKVQAEKK